MKKYHLAQINIAKAKAAMDSEIMRGFVERLEEINTLADKAPGFIWRLKDDAGDASAIQAYDDPSIAVNMSVWEDLDSLKNYVYRSIHVELLQGKKAWFNKMEKSHQALWWIPATHIPTLAEGKQRLGYLQKNGPSVFAFNFSKSFSCDQLPELCNDSLQ